MTNERKKMISLIPGGTIQFYEFSFDIRKLKKPDIRFFEHETDNATNSTSKWKIHFLNKDFKDLFLPVSSLDLSELDCHDVFTTPNGNFFFIFTICF